MKETADLNSSFHPIATARPDQWLYLSANGGVLYSETQRRFAGLSAAGVSAFQAIDGGRAADNLTVFGCPPANSDAAEAVSAIHALSQGVFPAEAPPIEWPALRHPCSANLEIHDVAVRVELPAGPLEQLCFDYFLNCPPSTKLAVARICARRAEEGWTIYINDREVLSSLQDTQLGLGFLHAARSLLYAESAYDLAFHAAMVAIGGSGVMLSGAREAGKSTLAAYLMAEGFNLISDEPVLLRLNDCSVLPLFLPVSLKEGSWTILDPLWSQLSHSPDHVRSDGTRIRLLHLPPAQCDTTPQPLTHIIFPQYNRSFATRAERLSPLQALTLLNDSGLVLSKRLCRKKFEAFLTMLSGIPAYTLRYSSLHESALLISGLVSGTSDWQRFSHCAKLE